MRGKVFPFLEIAIVQQDHPPPMRGKVMYSTSAVLTIGITPAYAGKSVKNLGREKK